MDSQESSPNSQSSSNSSRGNRLTAAMAVGLAAATVAAGIGGADKANASGNKIQEKDPISQALAEISVIDHKVSAGERDGSHPVYVPKKVIVTPFGKMKFDGTVASGSVDKNGVSQISSYDYIYGSMKKNDHNNSRYTATADPITGKIIEALDTETEKIWPGPGKSHKAFVGENPQGPTASDLEVWGGGPKTKEIANVGPIRSLEEVTETRARDMLNGHGANYYRGRVVFTGKDGAEHTIPYPIIQPMFEVKDGNENTPETQRLLTHPGDSNWSFGYIEKGVPGNLGEDNLVMLPVDSEFGRAKFYLDDEPLEANGKKIGVRDDGYAYGVLSVNFAKDSKGKPDFSVALAETGRGPSPLRKNGDSILIAQEIDTD